MNSITKTLTWRGSLPQSSSGPRGCFTGLTYNQGLISNLRGMRLEEIILCFLQRFSLCLTLCFAFLKFCWLLRKPLISFVFIPRLWALSRNLSVDFADASLAQSPWAARKTSLYNLLTWGVSPPLPSPDPGLTVLFASWDISKEVETFWNRKGVWDQKLLISC